jgi:hypothetical protein
MHRAFSDQLLKPRTRQLGQGGSKKAVKPPARVIGRNDRLVYFSVYG